MTLREKLKPFSGNRRRFLLLRISDLDTKTALKLCGVVRGTYNTWCQNPEFIEFYRELKEIAHEFKTEAIQMLRRDNQLEAVLLESKILQKMKTDIDQDTVPEGSILRTNLAREVYSKLMSELDVQPPASPITWEQRIQYILNPPNKGIEGNGDNPQITEGEIIDESIES